MPPQTDCTVLCDTTDRRIAYLRDSLRRHSKRILENKADLRHLNMEQHVLRGYLHDTILNRRQIQAALNANKHDMHLIEREQRALKEIHASYSHTLCFLIRRMRYGQ